MRHSRVHRLWSAALLLQAVPLALASGFARGIERATVVVEPRDVDEAYDYVIVGGGTAGLTVADRLTEDPDTTVLVIEYGELSEYIPTWRRLWIQDAEVVPSLML